LAQQSEAAEAVAARQLAFIDRLLADKEGLARRCTEGDRLLKVSVLGGKLGFRIGVRGDRQPLIVTHMECCVFQPHIGSSGKKVFGNLSTEPNQLQ